MAPASAQQQRVYQDVIRDIRITGNQRIERQTILTYLGLAAGSPFNQRELDQALKNLFATGFFADVNIGINQGVLLVQVVENPIINRVAFEGNLKMEDKDLAAELELRARSIYTRTKVQNDLKRILDIYRRSGRYSATVQPKFIQLDQNRVDLVYEINEGPVTKVKKITFLGNTTFSSGDLEEVVRTEQTRWYKFLTDDDKYDADRLLYDQELLRRFYVAHGYADFQVKSAIAELTPEKDAFYLTFTIDEGKQYNFGEVTVESSLRGATGEDLKSLVTSKQGEVYNADEVENTIDAMVKELGNRGYAFVDIDPVMNRDPDGQTVGIAYQIKEGPRVYVERINIIGNVRTLDEVIRREFRLAEGDPYSTSKLARSEQRINNLGFFEKVTVSNSPGSAPDRTVVNVEVMEKSTGEISFGAGFSSLDGALADVGIRETNLLGRGQDLRFRTMIASKRQQFDISFTEPYFLNRELSAGFDLYKTTQDLRRESSYDRESTGGALRMGYALTENLQHSVNYTIKKQDISNIRDGASRFITDQEGSTITSSVGHALIYDRRDNKFDPKDGYFMRFSQDFAGLGGDAKFIRNEVKGAYYHTFIPFWTFSVLGTGGTITGLNDDVRINDRFFIGGQDFRGFDRFGVGPRDNVSRDALGGNAFYIGTIEQRFPLGLPEDLGILGAAFIDAGSLWEVDETGPEVVDSNTVRMSAGVGVSWASPFGPVRIDLAQAIAKEDYDETEIFRFSFGTRF